MVKSSLAKIHTGLNSHHTAAELQAKGGPEPGSKPVLDPVAMADPEKPRDSAASRKPETEVPHRAKDPDRLPDPAVSNDFYVDRYEPLQSPKPWYKKKPFHFDKVIGAKTEPVESGNNRRGVLNFSSRTSTYLSGAPDWANARQLEDCLLWAFLKITPVARKHSPHFVPFFHKLIWSPCSR
jgi:hypothetical protein